MYSFKLITPRPALQPYVEQFILYETDSRAPITQNLIPSNKQYIGFLFEGNMQPHTIDRPLPVSKSYVLGQLSRPIKATYSENLKILAIHFKPTGMYQLFGIPMSNFTNKGVAFEAVVGAEGKYFIEEIFGADSLQKQIAIVERYLLQKIMQKNHRHAKEIEYACSTIRNQNGNIQVKCILKQVNMCERNFHRCFLEKVGISPKTFISIARINKALQMIESMSKVTWTDFAYQLNYVDQAHFNHDFKKFSGNNPTEYYYSRTDFEHFFYGD